jgi:hypothetical protein
VALKRDALLPHHAELLTASAISDAGARGHRSVTTKAELSGLGFSERQTWVPTSLLVTDLPASGERRERAGYLHRGIVPRPAA